jgi:hypothetical protein
MSDSITWCLPGYNINDIDFGLRSLGLSPTDILPPENNRSRVQYTSLKRKEQVILEGGTPPCMVFPYENTFMRLVQEKFPLKGQPEEH